MSKKIESILRLVSDFRSFHMLSNSSYLPMHVQQEELSADELDLIAAARQDSCPECVKSEEKKSRR